MLQLTGARKRFGEKLLFEGLDWLVAPQDRVGLVGGNGSGKTTLLKILAGLELLDGGEITRQKGLTIGYLPQDGLTLSGRSVFEECLSVFAEVLALEHEQRALADQLSHLDHESPEYRVAAERFHRVQDEFLVKDGYTLEAQVGAVLTGLGFPKPDWDRRTEEFSGGWQMRIALAKLLLERPNLLLLDEPTNHLDLEARNWLEEYLSAYPNAFLIVSHDRYFLDVTVKKVVELWNKGAHFYSGNFSRYETLKQERRAQLEAAYKNQQDKIHQLEVFITRFRYQATKASQVQSRIKELGRIERIEIPPEEKTIHFRFPQPKASGRVVLELRHVAKSYGSNQVFEDVSFLIERGDRVALVGVNGAGKSTLIRIMAGLEILNAGERVLGHNAEVDYFAQDQYKALDPAARLLEDLTKLVPRSTDTEIRGLLGCFLFSDGDVFKPIGVLSGGERNRYALARMLVMPSNVLLLDEPTNHLDLRAKDVLLGALLDFSGTVVFVSHDRYFIDKLATKVFEVGGGGVRIYPGNYEDYLSVTAVGSGQSGSGQWAVGSGQRAVDGGQRTVGSGQRAVGSGQRAVGSGQRAVGSGQRAVGSGQRAVGSGQREVGSGQRAVGSGQRAVDGEQWAVDGGQWTVGSGQRNPAAEPKKGGLAGGKSQRVNPIKAEQMKRRMAELEQQAGNLEREIGLLEAQQAGSYRDHRESARLAKEVERRRTSLALLLAEWEQVGGALEQ